MRYILLTHIVFYAINVHIRSCLIWWCEGWDEGVGEKGWGGAKEEGCCASAVCPESFAPPKCFQVCAVSDRLPQISGGDAGTRVHTHGKTHTETEAGEEDRGWGGASADGGEEPKKILPRKSRSAFLAALRSAPWEDSRGQVYVHGHGSTHLSIYWVCFNRKATIEKEETETTTGEEGGAKVRQEVPALLFISLFLVFFSTWCFWVSSCAVPRSAASY